MKLLMAISLLTLSLGCTPSGDAQQTIPLYEGAIPNSRPSPDEERQEITKDSILIIHRISRPTLTIYLPPKEKATGAAVVICPGGGYSIVAAGHEGHDVARRFNEMGVAAFVLKYRIPDNRTMLNPEIGPLQDAQRALQLVRERSADWKIDPARVGMMGFSAGGHLAASAGTHFNETHIPNPKGTSLRPDFLVLVYPVISFEDSVGHSGSRDRLIGKNPSPEKIRQYSNERLVSPQTPPSFLVHAKDDFVKVKNSLLFAEALQKAGVPAELYLYEKGGHGYGMVNPQSEIRWMDLVAQWLKKINVIR